MKLLLSIILLCAASSVGYCEEKALEPNTASKKEEQKPMGKCNCVNCKCVEGSHCGCFGPTGCPNSTNAPSEQSK